MSGMLKFPCIIFISSNIEDNMPNYLILQTSRKFRSLPLLLSSESDSSSMLEERVRLVMSTSSTSIIIIANYFQYFSVDWAETFSSWQNKFGCSWKTSRICVKFMKLFLKNNRQS
jgi:hypothetical protein